MNPLMLIATFAVILTVVYSIPQAVKVYLSNSPRAISGMSIVFMVFGSLAWALYGYFTSSETIAVAYIFLFIFNVLILLMIVQKAGINKVRMALLSIILTGAVVASILYLPLISLGYLGGFVSALVAIPQGFKMIRQREATGVSGLTYLLLAASSFCWIIYGHLTENMLLVVPNLLIFPSAALVYINVIKYRTSNFWYQQSINTLKG